ncbi:MAG: hypothetical protein JWO64_741 [Hyphomicrobiales bacterium]|jgi:hypothetical protein|nr:hypothetical protein [Hyphomicrobiales bacterium]
MIKLTHLRMAALTLVTLGAQSALAQERLDTMRMTCATSADIVRRSGAIVLHSGPNIYDRYVSSQNFCFRDEIMKPTWVPAADKAQCFVGYRCQREAWGAGPS